MTSKRKRVVSEDEDSTNTTQEGNLNGFFVPEGEEIEWRNKLLSLLSVPNGKSVFVPFSKIIDISRGLDGSVNIEDWENFVSYMDSLKAAEPNLQAIQKTDKTFTESFSNAIDIVARNSKDCSVGDMTNLQKTTKSLSTLEKSSLLKEEALKAMNKLNAGNLLKSKAALTNINWESIVDSYSGVITPTEWECPACGSEGCKFRKYVDKRGGSNTNNKEENINLKDDSDNDEDEENTEEKINGPQVVIRCNACNFRMARISIEGNRKNFSEEKEIFECLDCGWMYGDSNTCYICEEEEKETTFCKNCLNKCRNCDEKACDKHTHYGPPINCKTCRDNI